VRLIERINEAKAAVALAAVPAPPPPSAIKWVPPKWDTPHESKGGTDFSKFYMDSIKQSVPDMTATQMALTIDNQMLESTKAGYLKEVKGPHHFTTNFAKLPPPPKSHHVYGVLTDKEESLYDKMTVMTMMWEAVVKFDAHKPENGVQLKVMKGENAGSVMTLHNGDHFSLCCKLKVGGA